LKVPVEITSLSLPASPLCLQNSTTLLHVPFQFLVYYSVFFVWVGWGSDCPGVYAGLSQGWLWEYHVILICSPIGLPDVSQVGLELMSGGAGSLLFSQCNMAWSIFV
jgi:hypothetical protein